MKLGIIAGNRLLPIVLAQAIKKTVRDSYLVAICFKGETSKEIRHFVDKCYWLKAGKLKDLRETIAKENLKEWVMAGQINPLKIFKKGKWDQDLVRLVDAVKDLRPHTVFGEIIRCLEGDGVRFLDSTLYLKESLAHEGEMAGLHLNEVTMSDIEFGLKIVSGYVELDVGQTVVVKNKSTVALESLEGTDRTVRRAFQLAGRGCTVLKFSKANQDLRFDVPVIGTSTMRLLGKIGVACLVLEKERVLMLKKQECLDLAKRAQIPIVGTERVQNQPVLI